MYLHGANFRLPPLLKGLAHAVPRTTGSLGGMFPAALGHAGCGCWVQSGRSGGRISLFICGEGRSCRSKKYHPRVGCMHTARGLRACTSSMNSSSLFSCILEFLKFLIEIKLALSLFVVAAVVFSLYVLLGPLKTHTKLGAPFYWVLLKCPPMPQ